MFAIKLAMNLLIAFLSLLLLGQAHSKAVFGIGTRLIGDTLLVKDLLQSRPAGLGESPTIGFNYNVPEPITYIEILSKENVFADVSFSYHNDLVSGTITVTNVTGANDSEGNSSTSINTLPPFEVHITIYGFNETVSNVNSSQILNRDQQFDGRLESQWDEYEDYDEYLNLSDEALESADDTHYEERRNAGTETADVNDDDDDDDDGDDDVADGDDVEDGADINDDDFGNADKIIEVGKRQKGDYLIYETYQTSLASTQEPSTHSVIFYYIDSHFITYVRFIVFDHTTDKAADEINPPVAEYSHFSPHTLKALITDDSTTSLFVQMFIYGYRPQDRPVDYKPFLTSSAGAGLFGFTDTPLSVVTGVAVNAIDEDDDDDDDEEENDSDDLEAQARAERIDSNTTTAPDGASGMSPAYLSLCLPLMIVAVTRRQRA